MIKIENIKVEGFEPAIRGMRNPMNSWDKSDSEICFGHDFTDCTVDSAKCQRKDDEDFSKDIFCIGKNDLKLMKDLFQAGTEHRKYDRMIVVWMDITAPLYWWKEFDTYKVGTVADSCSTMHKIHAKEFVMDDFSVEHLTEGNQEGFKLILNCLNTARQNFLETKDKIWWWQMIQTLPSSYNQKRTVMMNYEVCARIIQQRSGHKLDEWHDLIKVLKNLPYLQEIMQI